MSIQGFRMVRTTLSIDIYVRSLMNPFRSAIVASVLFPVSLFVITAALV